MRETLYPSILRVKVDDELRKALTDMARREHLGTSTFVRRELRRIALEHAVAKEKQGRRA